MKRIINIIETDETICILFDFICYTDLNPCFRNEMLDCCAYLREANLWVSNTQNTLTLRQNILINWEFINK